MEELGVRFDIRIKILEGGTQEVTIGGSSFQDVQMLQTASDRKILANGLANAVKGLSGLLADVLASGDCYSTAMGSA